METVTATQTKIIGPQTDVDLRNKAWLANYDTTTTARYPLVITGSSATITIRGGAVYGSQFGESWRNMKRNYDGDAFHIWDHGGNRTFSGFHAENVEDCFGVGSKGFNHFKNCTARNIWDDYLEADNLPDRVKLSGGIVDGCFVFVSGRLGGTSSGETKTPMTVEIDNYLVRLDRVPEPTEPSGWLVGGLFKRDTVGNPGTASIQPIIRDSVFCARYNSTSRFLSGIPSNAQCENVTFIWEGDEEYQGTFPSGVEVVRDRTLWPRLMRQRQKELNQLEFTDVT